MVKYKRCKKVDKIRWDEKKGDKVWEIGEKVNIVWENFPLLDMSSKWDYFLWHR